MPHIFISYAKRDGKQLASTLNTLLEQISGITVWMDQELTPGRSWEAQIQREIDRCDYVIVLITSDVNRPETDQEDRSFVLNEIIYARQKRKKIIPILVHKTDIPVILASTEYIDFASSQEAGIQRLVNKILVETNLKASDGDVIASKILDPTYHSPAAPVANPLNSRLTIVMVAVVVLFAAIAGLFVLINPPPPPIVTPTPNAQTLAAILLMTRQAPTQSPTIDITNAIETAIADILATTNIVIAGTLAQEITQTAAARPTDTPTPTPNQTFTLEFQQRQTEAVEVQQVQALTQVVQLTAGAPTNTLPPTVTPTPTLEATQTPQPTITPTFNLTVTAQVQQTELAAVTQVFEVALTDVAQQTSEPQPDVTATVRTDLCDYVFGANDTFSQIAVDNNFDVEELVRLNPNVNPRRVSPGTLIKIPCSGELGYSSTNRLLSNAQWSVVQQVIDDFSMVLVPTGCFEMGSFAGDDEYPVEVVCINQPFWIDQYEVTNKQYGSTGLFTEDDLPRENITWAAARDFCEARGGHLPTEAQWEYAARGPDELRYPWGNDFDGTKLNFCDASCSQPNRDATFDDGFQFTSPVGSFPDGASWVGAEDMSGNVWEWTNTLYNQTIHPYPYATNDGREKRDENLGPRVRRGGSWDYEGSPARTANRLSSPPESTASDQGVIGFRCVMDYVEEVP